MYLIGTNYPLAYAYDYIHNNWSNSNSNRSMIWFFKGPVPVDFSEIPHSWIVNPSEMAKNAVGCTQLTLARRPSTNADQIQEWTHLEGFIDAKGNQFNPVLNRWMLGDCTFLAERSHQGVDRYGDFAPPFSVGSNQPHIYVDYHKYREDIVLRDLYNATQFYWRRSKDNQEKETNYYTNISGGNVDDWYWIVEFNNTENIDGVYYRQGAESSGNSSAVYANRLGVSAWDPTLNSGQGDWGPELLVNIGQYSTERRHVDFGQTFTTNRLRVRSISTPSSGWYYAWMIFTSSTEPATGKDPYDVTWALVSLTGANTSNSNPGEYPNYYFDWWNNFSGAHDTEGYPYLLCDVGEAGDDATIILNKSKNVEPFSQLTPIHMGLNFKDA